jgi:hypothetical protein
MTSTVLSELKESVFRLLYPFTDHTVDVAGRFVERQFKKLLDRLFGYLYRGMPTPSLRTAIEDINKHILQRQDEVRASGGSFPVLMSTPGEGFWVAEGFSFVRKIYVKRKDADREKLRSEFDAARKNYLEKLVREKCDELQLLGIDAEGIARMQHGNTPRGYEVHHLFPLDDGGDNDDDNLILIENRPCHRALHSRTVIANQGINRLKTGESITVALPMPPKGCYIVNQQTTLARMRPVSTREGLRIIKQIMQ